MKNKKMNSKQKRDQKQLLKVVKKLLNSFLGSAGKEFALIGDIYSNRFSIIDLDILETILMSLDEKMKRGDLRKQILERHFEPKKYNPNQQVVERCESFSSRGKQLKINENVDEGMCEKLKNIETSVIKHNECTKILESSELFLAKDGQGYVVIGKEIENECAVILKEEHYKLFKLLRCSFHATERTGIVHIYHQGNFVGLILGQNPLSFDEFLNKY